MNYNYGQSQFDNSNDRLLPFTLGLGFGGGFFNPFFPPYPFFFYRRPFFRPFGRRPWSGYYRPWR